MITVCAKLENIIRKELNMTNFTFIGNKLYDLCFAWTKFILKHKNIYYALSFTWGILNSLAGLVCSLVLRVVGIQAERYYWMYCQKMRAHWGGFSVGINFIRDTTSRDEVSYHEFGHSFQNCLFGPFMILFIAIPSMVRYWHINIRKKLGKPVEYDYDSIWFEKSATDCGKYAIEFLSSEKEQ